MPQTSTALSTNIINMAMASVVHDDHEQVDFLLTELRIRKQMWYAAQLNSTPRTPCARTRSKRRAHHLWPHKPATAAESHMSLSGMGK